MPHQIYAEIDNTKMLHCIIPNKDDRKKTNKHSFSSAKMPKHSGGKSVQEQQSGQQ
jgi:hypothetical protein